MFNKFKAFITIVFIIMVIVGLNSCATVFAGKKNTVNIKDGTPSQAQIFLDGVYLGDAPFKERISKYKLQHGSIIEIKKEGFETMSYEVVRSPHILWIAADILSGSIPLIIDVANGNIYRPNTRNLKYDLVPLEQETKTVQSKPELQEK